jgi:hypothetical protein
MPRCRVLLMAVALAVAASAALGAEMDDARLQFRLKLPRGFRPFPEGLQCSDDAVCSYVLGNPRDNQPDIALMIQRMHGVIGRGSIAKKIKTPGVTCFKESWGEFELEVFRCPRQIDHLRTVTFTVQVPLRYEAIQLVITGPAGREDEVRSLLKELLATLQGDTNWLTEKERDERMATGLWRLLVTITVVVYLIHKLRRKRWRWPRLRWRR